MTVTLLIRDISFRDFRSYESLELHDIGRLSVLVGPNAVGKTNVVEGVQLLTALASFRHATIEQLVRRGRTSAYLQARVSDGNRLLDVSLIMEGHVKRYKLNGKPKRPSDLKGLVPSVTFTPDDLDLVKGPMGGRRQALDALGSQLNANYYLILKDYEKVVRHKNRLLKDEASPVLIDSIDEMLITCGAQLSCYRAALFDKMAPYVKARYESISGRRETLDAWYTPSWKTFDEANPVRVVFTREEAREQLALELARRRGEEVARRRSLVGPHADQVNFMIDGANAALYGSQGQQRSVVLSYKLAEAAVVEEMLGQKPVLLLDDVMSELDGQRREALVDYVSGDVQAFITTANLAYFDDAMLREADVIQLPLDV